MKQTILLLISLASVTATAIGMETKTSPSEEAITKLLTTSNNPEMRGYASKLIIKSADAFAAEQTAHILNNELEQYISDNILLHNLMLDELDILSINEK